MQQIDLSSALKMTHRYKYVCLVCQRRDVMNIISHLRNVHGLEQEQLVHWLPRVTISRLYIT